MFKIRIKNSLFVLFLVGLLVFSNSSMAFATDWSSPPSKKQIKAGDTLFKGDGEIKVFDKEGNEIYSGPMNEYSVKDDIGPLGQDYDNGNYGGWTDIWWEYGSEILFDSGPAGDAATYAYGDPTDMVYVRTVLYEDPPGSSWTRIDSSTETVYDDDSVTTSVSCIEYGYLGYVLTGFKAESTHRVEDEEYGWDAQFYTEDEF